MHVGPSGASAEFPFTRARALDAAASGSREAVVERVGSPWILPVALGFALVAVSVGATRSHFEPLDGAVIGGLFGLLALALCASAQVVARLGAIPAALAALVPGATLAWHLREQTRALDGWGEFGVAVLLGTVVCAVLLRRSRRSAGFGVPLAAAAALALAAGCVAAYQSSDTLRWHLLHHARVLGVPTFLLLGDPVGPILDDLWRAGATTPPSAPELDGALLEATRSGEAPDLVLVLIDTLRADSLAAYGGDRSLMPRLDALADSSLVLDDVSANATYTKSSVASMFTGLLPEEHGAVDHPDRLSDERLTLAEVLRSRGYETAAFLANHPNVGRKGGFDQGFDAFFEVEVPGQTYARAEQLNARLDAWLAERSARDTGDRPVFVYLHYLDPHTPYLSGWPDRGRSPAAMRRGYDAELRYTDEQVAAAIGRLEAALGPDTIFVLVSDHGEEFGEHGAQGHGHALYRELLQIPALVHQRGGPRGRIETRLEGRDVFEMVLFLSRFGIDGLPEWAVARSRVNRYASQYIRRHKALLRPERWFSVMRSFEDGDRQLIWSAFGPTEEVYDLRRDPEQSRNLRASRGPEAAALREALVASVSGWARREADEIDPEAEALLKQLGYLE